MLLHSRTVACIFLLFIIFYFDRLFFKIFNLCTRRIGYESHRLMEYETVWSSRPTGMLSNRSIFNPDMFYDSTSKTWYVVSRYTKGHRISQFLSCILSKEEDIIIAMILMTLDNNFRELSRREIYVEREPIYGFKSTVKTWQHGEDPRIFYDETIDKFVVQATIYSTDGCNHIAHGVLIENDSGVLLWKIIRICGINGDTRYNKNWSYIRKNLYLSHCYPEWKVVRMDSNGNSRIAVGVKTIINNRLRCTSKFCQFSSNSYLTLLHTYNEFYRCVFCEVDKEKLLPIRYSHPLDFTEDDNYVEFPSGLYIVGDYVFIGLGVNDVECKIIKVHKEIVKSYLL